MLSVILCTYNRDQYIYNVLECISEGNLPHSEYEIVLVDNNCTDNTRSVCAAFAKAHKDVQSCQALHRIQSSGEKEGSPDV